jgi:two-component system response regulator YesN
VDQIGQIPQSYKQAKLAIRNKIIRGTGHIYDYESLHKRSADRGVLLTGEDESKLFFWLNEHNAGALQGWIEQRIRTLTEAPAATCMQLEWFCADLYLLFRKYLIANTKVTDWIIGEMDDLLLWLQNLTVWQDAVVQMQHIAVNIIGYLSQINPAKDVMEEVKSYLDLHYGESITLQSISEKFYIHPNYFSRRFKEKYGQSFVDYLTALRMKTALDWLRETDVKIQDIANKVGFEDASYFSNVFRKFYGVTPKQYREQNS